MNAVLGVAVFGVEIVFFCFSVLEELERDLIEQSVRQHVFVLFEVRTYLLAEAVEFGLDLISGSVVYRFGVADDRTPEFFVDLNGTM